MRCVCDSILCIMCSILDSIALYFIPHLIPYFCTRDSILFTLISFRVIKYVILLPDCILDSILDFILRFYFRFHFRFFLLRQYIHIVYSALKYVLLCVVCGSMLYIMYSILNSIGLYFISYLIP